MDLYTDGDQARFVTKVNGSIADPWVGDPISHQRSNNYSGPGGATRGCTPGHEHRDRIRLEVGDRNRRPLDIARVFTPDGTPIARGTPARHPARRA